MTFGGKGRMLALEISPRVIRAAEFLPGTRPLKVQAVATADWPGGEPVRLARFLREFLEGRGFTAKKAVVSYLGPLIEHRIYTIPPASAESRDALLRGKIAGEVSTPVSELRVTGEVIGKVTEQGVDRNEVLAVFTPEFEIRRLVFLLVEAGLSPVRVTSVPLALLGIPLDSGEDEIVGLLHAEPSRAVICVSQGGKLRFAREFPVEFLSAGEGVPEIPELNVLDPPGGDSGAAVPHLSGEDVFAERMVTELTRSLLYYRQLSRGGGIQRLHWSGIPPSPRIVTRVSERLKIAVEPHPALAAAEFSPGLPGDAAEYAVPVGLAISAEDPEKVNLLPPEYIHRKRRWGNYAAVAAIAAAFLIANAVLYMGLHNAEKRYRETLESARSGANLHPALEKDFLHWVSLRDIVREASAGEQMLGAPFTRWKDCFAALGAPVPREMAFSRLSLERQDREYRARLYGSVRGATPVEVQERMNRFLSAVEKQGILSDLRYEPIGMHPLGEKEGRGGYEQEFLLRFRLGEGT